MEIANIVLDGFLMGTIYALVALGLTLIFGIIKIINFAHGSFLMLSMYVAYWLVKSIGVDVYWSILIPVPVMFLIGYGLNHTLIVPVLKKEKGVREPLSVLLLTAGLWTFMDNIALMLFGPYFRSVQTPYSGKMIRLGMLSLRLPLCVGFLITIATALFLYCLLYKTKLGRAIRATGQDREAAFEVGVDVYRIYDVSFGIGIAILGVAGAVLLPMFYVHPTSGVVFDIRAFIIVVLGGLGSIPGAFAGGILIGVIEALGSFWIGSTWIQAWINILFVLFLFFRPMGLFGIERG